MSNATASIISKQPINDLCCSIVVMDVDLALIYQKRMGFVTE